MELPICLVSIMIWSKFAFRMPPTWKMNIRMMVGLMDLIVICHIFCARVAPSISAASYISWLMLVIAEMKIIAFQPSSFQISVHNVMPQKYLPSVKKPIGSLMTPIHMRNSLMAPPSVDMRSNINVAHTTQEMKCGR